MNARQRKKRDKKIVLRKKIERYHQERMNLLLKRMFYPMMPHKYPLTEAQLEKDLRESPYAGKDIYGNPSRAEVPQS